MAKRAGGWGSCVFVCARALARRGGGVAPRAHARAVSLDEARERLGAIEHDRDERDDEHDERL